MSLSVFKGTLRVLINLAYAPVRRYFNDYSFIVTSGISKPFGFFTAVKQWLPFVPVVNLEAFYLYTGIVFTKGKNNS